MLNTLRRRLPIVEVLLAPSPVQGVEAPPALVKAIQSLALQSPDVILMAHGGGSIEDLWAFNDERVVRAVANSPIPIICGVGHETDFTLSDFAADLRAPTPTAAAELATQITLLDLRALLENQRNRLAAATLSLLADQKNIVSSLTAALRYATPERRILSERQRVDELAWRAHSSLLHRIQLQSTQVRGMERRLEALNPLAVLARGYAVVTQKGDGSVVTQVAQTRPGQQVQIRVSDGQVDAEIKDPNS